MALPASDTLNRPARLGVVPWRRALIARLSWQRLALLLVLTFSAALEFLGLQDEGYGNTYYAAGVKSMLTSWHNFFFVSFDAGGFVSMDKPPLGFWVQATSARLFGFSGLSILNCRYPVRFPALSPDSACLRGGGGPDRRSGAGSDADQRHRRPQQYHR
jgi:hypothetical protein